jgi:hypothetical protein
MRPSKEDDDLVEDLHALDITTTTTTTTTTNIITQEVEEEDDDETNGNYIPFRINGKPAPGSTKSDIPRYLYRICTANSRTDTDSEWIQSRDAADDQQDSETDIFARTDKHAAAEMINAHLRRKLDPSRRNNLVSWTSSLLKALLFIFDRHTSSRPNDDDNDDDNGDSLELEDIYLCMLDTSSYNEGAYIRAPSLIAAFREYSTELAEVEQQRSTQPCHWGEYLTQGALNIEGACEIVSADSLVERGLFTLLPELEALAARWNRNGQPAAPSWDEALEKLRGAWEGGDVDLKLVEELTDDEERCAGKIAELFGVYLQTPLAAALAALRPRREGDPRLAFRALRTDGTFDFRFFDFFFLFGLLERRTYADTWRMKMGL